MTTPGFIGKEGLGKTREGRRPFTGGCVAIPEDQMNYVMRHVSPDCTVIIDTLDNLGGTFSKS